MRVTGLSPRRSETLRALRRLVLSVGSDTPERRRIVAALHAAIRIQAVLPRAEPAAARPSHSYGCRSSLAAETHNATPSLRNPSRDARISTPGLSRLGTILWRGVTSRA